jgi:hypothetical protein
LFNNTAGVSAGRRVFDSGPGLVRFVVEKLALEHVFLQALLFFFLPISFHQCPIFFLFLIIILSEGHAGEAWETLNK